MRKTSKAILIALVFFCFPLAVGAVEFEIDLEWEEILGAAGYEIELYKLNKGKRSNDPEIFKSTETNKTVSVKPGRYDMRVRSVDLRGAPGDWSEYRLVEILFDTPKTVGPKKKQILKASSAIDLKVDFSWTPIEGAESYRVTIVSADEKVRLVEDVKGTSWSKPLPVAHRYVWKVETLMDDGTVGEETEQYGNFFVLGKVLDAPTLIAPEDIFVINVEWDPVEYADSYAYLLLKQLPNKKWKKVAKGKTKKLMAPVANKHGGGRFKIFVRAKGRLRKSSKFAKMEFDVWEGSRTPAGIENQKLIYSVNNPKDFFINASGATTFLGYESQNKEQASQTEQDFLGGTGRLGGGWTPKGSNHGIQGFGELSGFLVDGKNKFYLSGEMSYMYRMTVFTTWTLRLNSGLYWKQLPEFIGSNSTNVLDFKNVTFGGVTAGMTLAIPTGDRSGWYIKARAYPTLLTLNTPNSESVLTVAENGLGATPFEFGGLYSKRFNKRDVTKKIRDWSGSSWFNPLKIPMISYYWMMRWFVPMQNRATISGGLTYRRESVSYSAIPGNPADPDSTSAAIAGDINTVKTEGVFINVIVEWPF